MFDDLGNALGIGKEISMEGTEAATIYAHDMTEFYTKYQDSQDYEEADTVSALNESISEFLSLFWIQIGEVNFIRQYKGNFQTIYIFYKHEL